MDERTRRQKMEAMASQSDASPHEAAFARRWLEEHPKKILDREDILESADDPQRASVRHVRYYDETLHAWVVMEVYPSSSTFSSSNSSNGTFYFWQHWPEG